MYELKESTSVTRYAVKKGVSISYKHNEMVVYQIIPHSDVANNNKRLWRTIYKMYELYERPGARIERDGFKFTYREKDAFWFDVVFRQKDGKKSVEFYVATSEFQAVKLKRKIENKMNVTIKEANIEDLQVPKENTIVQELRYLKHDIFSLNSNTSEVKTPISNLLNTVDELFVDGDMARFSVCAEAENRNKWIKSAQWAYEKANNGKVPQRATINGKRLLYAAKVGISAVINEINEFITDVMQAINNSFIKSKKGYEKKPIIKKSFNLEEAGTARIERNKGSLPVFRTHIRVVAHSEDRLTRDTLSESLALSMQDLAETNELNGVKANGKKRERVIDELNTLKLTSTTRYDPNVNLVSTDEMAKLALMMPNKELQQKYAEELNTKQRVEAEVPLVIQNEKNLLVGYAEIKDKKIRVGLPTHQKDNFYCGYTFIGKQGSGKDTAIQNFVQSASINHGISSFIIDWIGEPGHRGMADGIRDLLPPNKVIDIDLANEDYIVPMDLTEVIGKLGRKGSSRFAAEMMDFMELEGLTRSQKYLTEASKAAKGSLLNIKKLIEDEDFRLNRIEELSKEGNIRLARDLLSWGSNEQIGNKCDPILNRLNVFFGDDTLYDIFAQQPKADVNFEQWMKEGKTVIIRIPKRKLGNAAKVLAHWITLKVLMTRMLMEQEDKDKHGCFMVFNEPEQVESEGLARLMGRIATEGRKERLGSIFAFHHWGKIPTYLRDNLIAGGVNQFLFANDHKKTFEFAKERLEPTFSVEEALRTPKHHAIAILNTEEALNAFLVRMLPPIDDDERYDNSFLTKRHARMYGRSWSELQKVL